MKRYSCFSIIALALLFIISCNVEKNDKYIALKATKDSLEVVSQQKEEAINEFVDDLNAIQENLAVIKEKESLITMSTKNGMEHRQDVKDQINEDIVRIYELMLENKEKVAELGKKLRRANVRIGKLDKMVMQLKVQLEEKDVQIADLEKNLTEKNVIIDEMGEKIDVLVVKGEEMSDVIQKQTQEINTAYYAFGTAKELKEQNVISKEGGFIGIGRTEKLPKNFNREYFTKIDITKDTIIDVMSKKAKIVTSHPEGSFKLAGEDKVDKIEIVKPEEFWSASKYLVIVVD